MDKLLIVDGHNLLFQMFYGMPARIYSKEGKPIHGVLGFIGALLKIIKITAPTHIVVLFDGEHENLRSTLDADYKKNRYDYSQVEEENNPFSQLDYIYSALNFLQIRFFEEDEYEVDDIIASYVYRYGKRTEIVISSFDSDYFQLIDDKVSVLRYRGVKSVVCDRGYVFKRYGILPEFYADFKSLVGDNSDNIRGVENVGVKTAMKLIGSIGGIEEIIARSFEIESERIRNSVIKNERLLRKNYDLIKLNDVGKLPYELGDLKYFDNGFTTSKVLESIGLTIK